MSDTSSQHDNHQSRNWMISFFYGNLLWVAMFATVAFITCVLVDAVRVDFLHINPGRSQTNAVASIFVFTPFFMVVNLLGVFTVLGLPQVILTIQAYIIMCKFPDRSLLLATVPTPLLAIISWYCYDYLTPSNLSWGGAPDLLDRYQHGITLHRYLIMLAIQFGVTLFSFARLQARLNNKKASQLIGLMFLLVVCAGIAWNFYLDPI